MRGPGVANGWMTEKCAQCTGDGVVVGTRRGVNLYGRHEDAAEVGSGTLLCHGSALPLFCDVVSYLAMLVRLSRTLSTNRAHLIKYVVCVRYSQEQGYTFDQYE